MLLLAVCSFEQTEGYNIEAASCVLECFARFDMCSDSDKTSAEDCDNDYYACEDLC